MHTLSNHLRRTTLVILFGALLTACGLPGSAVPSGSSTSVPADGGAAVVWHEDNHNYAVSGILPIEELVEIANGLEDIGPTMWRQRMQPQ